MNLGQGPMAAETPLTAMRRRAEAAERDWQAAEKRLDRIAGYAKRLAARLADDQDRGNHRRWEADIAWLGALFNTRRTLIHRVEDAEGRV